MNDDKWLDIKEKAMPILLVLAVIAGFVGLNLLFPSEPRDNSSNSESEYTSEEMIDRE